MMIIYKTIASVLCVCINGLLFYILRIWNKSAIVEVGYRNHNRFNKSESQELPIWNRILYWELCKKAKHNHLPVWIYFGCNLVLCLAWAFFPFLCSFCICFTNLRKLLLWELGYTIGILFAITIVRIPLDLIYLPSEQKRYGIGDKKRKK